MENDSSYAFSNVADFVNDWIYNGNTVILSGLTVTAQSPASGQVNVAVGIASQAGSPIHVATQQICNVLSGSPGTNTWGTGEASGSSPRIDIVVAQYATLDGNPQPRNVNNNGTITSETLNTNQQTYYALNVVHGTAGSSPVAPAVPSGWFLLATINVPANATTIVSGDITDNTPTLKNSGGWLSNVSGGILSRNDSNSSPELDTASGILLKLGTSGAQLFDNTTAGYLDIAGSSVNGVRFTGAALFSTLSTFSAGISGTGSVGALTVPWGNLTSVPSLAYLGTAQTFTAAQTFSAGITGTGSTGSLTAGAGILGTANTFSALQTFSAGATIASGQTLGLSGATVSGGPSFSGGLTSSGGIENSGTGFLANAGTGGIYETRYGSSWVGRMYASDAGNLRFAVYNGTAWVDALVFDTSNSAADFSGGVSAPTVTATPSGAGGFLANSPAGGIYETRYGSAFVGRMYASGSGHLRFATYNGTAWIDQLILGVNGGWSTPYQITSTVATGTAPLAVTSTTPVANLNVAGLGGTFEATVMPFIGGATQYTGTATAAGTATINAQFLGAVHSSAEYYFEATLFCASGDTGYAGVWDVTAGALVANSTVSTTSTTPAVVRTSATLSLTPGHIYALTGWVSAGDFYIQTARVVAQI